jgi:6-phosphogluconolactonase (cycloisomerase 2 family)
MHRYAYIGTYTRNAPGGASLGEQARGIHIYDTTVEPWQAVGCLRLDNPSFLTLHPRLNVLYAVSESDNLGGRGAGALIGYRLDDLTAPLFRLPLPVGATSPAHVAIDAAGRHVVISAYAGGVFVIQALDADGQPQGKASTFGFDMPGLHCERQQAAHAHFASPLGEGDDWLVCDLGTDTVARLSLANGQVTRHQRRHGVAGAGPRHAAIHPSSAWIYVLNELHATLDYYRYDAEHGSLYGGPFSDAAAHEGGQQSISLLPEGYTGPRNGSSIVMHPSGRMLFASTRRLGATAPEADSVSAWSIDTRSGALQYRARHTDGINCPRALIVSPWGDTLYVLNQRAGTIAACAIDLAAGGLDQPRVVAHAPTPVCLVSSPVGPAY